MTAPNWPRPDTAAGLDRHQAKRLRHLERRRNITNPTDLLGPGFGATAVQVLDWAADEAAFNGYFYSDPGSLSSPDTAQSWIGITVSEQSEDDDGPQRGVQKVWSYRDAGGAVEYVRTFAPGLSGRAYTPWRATAGAHDWTPLALADGWGPHSIGGHTAAYRVNGRMVEMRGIVGVASGAFIAGLNGPVATLPASIVPPVLTAFPVATESVLGAGGYTAGSARINQVDRGLRLFVPAEGATWFSLDNVRYEVS